MAAYSNNFDFQNVIYACLFSLMLIFPGMYQPIKALLLFIVLLFSLKKNIYIHSTISKYYKCFIFFGVYTTILGFLLGNEHFAKTLGVSIVWPLCFVIILGSIHKTSFFTTIIKVIIYCHAFLVAYDLIFCFSVIYGFSVPDIYMGSGLESNFSYYEGITSRLNFVNLNTLTFTGPVVLLLWLAKLDCGVNRNFQTFSLLATFALYILCGRRSMMLIFLLSPIAIILFANVFKTLDFKYLKKNLCIILIILLIALYYFYSVNPDLFIGYINTFTKAFDSDVEPIKFAQRRMFEKVILDNPLFGNGAGAMYFEPSPGRGRYSYQFELSYHHALANGGLLGFGFYIFALFGPLLSGYKYVKKFHDVHLCAILYGYFFMLVAHATNPVFCNFDLMLSYLLCTTRLNYILCNNKK